MKYSICIPSYDPEHKKHDMFMQLIESVEKHSVGRDYEIIIRKNGPSYVESHNQALYSASGDYLIVLNDDVVINDDQWLEKFTSMPGIVSWKWADFRGIMFPEFTAWSMSRYVYNQLGPMDDKYKHGMNFEDVDYAFTAYTKNIPWYTVDIKLTHFVSGTFNTYYKEQERLVNINREIFENKWNDQYLLWGPSTVRTLGM